MSLSLQTKAGEQRLCHERFRRDGATVDRYFASEIPPRIFVCVPEWTGQFDIEVDCIALA
jgi:2-iminobutanoate/2-iminopropanoate deaminase